MVLHSRCREISFLIITHTPTTILDSNNSEIKSVHWCLSLPPNMEWHLPPFHTPYSKPSLCSFVVTLIALLCNALTKAPSRSFNQVTKRLRLTLGSRLKQFQLTDSSLHTLIWKIQFKLHNPDPKDDRRSPKQNIHPFRSQARPTFLHHGVPDRAVKSNRHIVTSLCLRGEWCSGRDLRDIEVNVLLSRDQLN